MCSLIISQWLLYKSVVVAAVAAMDCCYGLLLWTRTHKSIVVAVVAAVDITRTHIYCCCCCC